MNNQRSNLPANFSHQFCRSNLEEQAPSACDHGSHMNLSPAAASVPPPGTASHGDCGDQLAPGVSSSAHASASPACGPAAATTPGGATALRHRLPRGTRHQGAVICCLPGRLACLRSSGGFSPLDPLRPPILLVILLLLLFDPSHGSNTASARQKSTRTVQSGMTC